MTRKDFVLIASVLKNELDTAVGFDEVHGAEAIRGVARTFAITLKRNNPRFDTSRFLTACGLEN